MTSRQKIILGVFIFVCLLIFIFGSRLMKPKPQPLTLEFWGIDDKSVVFSSLLDDFYQLYPQIRIVYSQKDAHNYEEELIRAFAADNAPDIFMLPAKWLPLHFDKISPLEFDKQFNLKRIRELYPQAIETTLVFDNKIYGLPLYFDTLGLYYNQDIFDSLNIASSPATWEEVIRLVPRLRKIDRAGNITRAAIALGTSNNIKWAANILSTLMMQYDSPMVDLQKKKVVFEEISEINNRRLSAGEEALKFYARFSDVREPIYTWNREMPEALQAFCYGKTAMFIGYSQDRQLIKKIAPHLNFRVAELPFVKEVDKKINNALIMALTVSRKSKSPFYSWEFIKFLNNKDSAEKYFLQTKKLPFLRDLIVLYQNDAEVGNFISQLLVSRTWYQPDYKVVEDIFEEMIEAVTVRKMPAAEAVRNASRKINLLFAGY